MQISRLSAANSALLLARCGCILWISKIIEDHKHRTISFFPPSSLCGVLVFDSVSLSSPASLSSRSAVSPSLSHSIFQTQLCRTLSFTHTTLSHTFFHTHRQLCHTPFFTHNFVTHYLSHTTLSHTIFHTHTSLSHTIFVISFTHNSVTNCLSHTTLSHTHNFVTSFLSHTQRCCTPSFTHNFVTHCLSHKFVTHDLCYTQLCHTLSFTLNFVTHTPLSRTIFHTQLCHTHLCHTPSFAHRWLTILSHAGTWRGRRGTWRHGSSICVAGVALHEIDLRFGFQVYMALGWLMARLVRVSRLGRRVTLRGRRGILGDMDSPFAWQAWHLATWK